MRLRPLIFSAPGLAIKRKSLLVRIGIRSRAAEYTRRRTLLRITAFFETFLETDTATRDISEEATRNEKKAELKYFLDSSSGLKSPRGILLDFGSILPVVIYPEPVEGVESN